MPYENPSFVPEIADLVRAANGAAWDRGESKRFDWMASGTTRYHSVGGESLAETTFSPWHLRIMSPGSPLNITHMQIAYGEDPDNPDAWVIDEEAYCWFEPASTSKLPSRSASVPLDSFIEIARVAITSPLTPEATWELIESHAVES